jgi:hypothetical protein
MLSPPPHAFVTSRHCPPAQRGYAPICVKKGKTCGSSYVLRHGSLVIYNINDGMERASHNLLGFELYCVYRLHLLQLAPGSHMKCFCSWFQSVLCVIYAAVGAATDTIIPKDLVSNTDLAASSAPVRGPVGAQPGTLRQQKVPVQ